MKFKYFILFILFLIFFEGSAYAQAQKHIITLNNTTPNYVSHITLEVFVGDTIQFMTTGGEFAIFLEDAIYYFNNLDSRNLEIKLNASDPVSDEYVVMANDRDSNAELFYFVYCLTDNNWADAPPVIVIRNR